MALADDDGPARAARADLVAGADTLEAGRGRHHAPAVEVAALAARLDQVRLEAGGGVEAGTGLDEGRGVVEREHAARQPLGACHEEARAGRLDEPARLAQVVGMEVGDQQAGDGPAGQQAAEQTLPEEARRRIADAGVDERPGVAVIEDPEIDVIEGEGQPRPQPEDARSHGHGPVQLGDVGRIAQARRHGRHRSLLVRPECPA